MLIQEKKQRPVVGRTAREQRTGIDRRVLSYDWHIPERRGDRERRLNGKCTSGQQQWQMAQ